MVVFFCSGAVSEAVGGGSDGGDYTLAIALVGAAAAVAVVVGLIFAIHRRRRDNANVDTDTYSKYSQYNEPEPSVYEESQSQYGESQASEYN